MENERTFDYTTMEGYDLPSGGQIYSEKVNPHVELRSMTARDEMKRLSPSTTPFKTLADIIEGCMVEKPAIHVYDMALGDYEFLLHKLRIVTYGNKYKITCGCPYCGHEFDTETDLNKLNIKQFNIEEFNDLRTFTLPVSGKQISLNFHTPRMLDEIESKAKDMKRRFSGATTDFQTLTSLTASISTVDGAYLDVVEKENFINQLPAKDMLKIMNNLDKLNRLLGIDNEFFVSCAKCKQDIKSFFRFGPEFFRPTNI